MKEVRDETLPDVVRPYRRRALLQAVAAGLEFLVPLPLVHATPGREPVRFQTWGYYPLWMDDSWRRMNLAIWNRLVLFELPVHQNGTVDMPDRWHEKWQPLADHARHCGAGVDLAFTLLGEPKFDYLFSRPALRHRLIADIMRHMNAAAANGIHIDVEAFGRVSEPAVAGLRKFVADLCREIRRQDSRRTVSVFFPVGGERELFDRESLAYPDWVVLQGYDAHWAESRTAGPLSPLKGKEDLSWDKSLRRLLALGVPRSKVLFSIPYFGYEWPVVSPAPGSATTGPAITTTYAPVDPRVLPLIRESVAGRLARYRLQRDADSGSPFYVYRETDGGWRQGWFEDGTSLAEKFDFVIREGLRGIAAFPLGYDGGAFDPLIQQKFGARPVCHR